MYICDDCDFYFLHLKKCPKCGSENVSKTKDEPKMVIEDIFNINMVFDENN